jgi:hypothetical protein
LHRIIQDIIHVPNEIRTHDSSILVVNGFPSFHGIQMPSTLSQEPDSKLYPEPDEPSSHSLTLFL